MIQANVIRKYITLGKKNIWAEKKENKGLLVAAVGESSVEAFRKISAIWILVVSLAIRVFKSPRQHWNC